MIDFDFVVDIDGHLFLVSGLVDGIGLWNDMDVNGLLNVIGLWDRIEARDFVDGIWYLILTFVDLV